MSGWVLCGINFLPVSGRTLSQNSVRHEGEKKLLSQLPQSWLSIALLHTQICREASHICSLSIFPPCRSSEPGLRETSVKDKGDKCMEDATADAHSLLFYVHKVFHICYIVSRPCPGDHLLFVRERRFSMPHSSYIHTFIFHAEFLDSQPPAQQLAKPPPGLVIRALADSIILPVSVQSQTPLDLFPSYPLSVLAGQ